MRRAKRTLSYGLCSVVTAGVLIGLLVSSVDALTIRYWTGATDQYWSNSGNWTGGAPNPGDWDQVVFDSNATGNLATYCDIVCGGAGFDKITVANPAGNVSISTTNVFGIGDGGIDMSAAESDLTINAYVALRNGDNTPMPMNVAAGRTLSLTQDVVGSSKTIEKRGEGKLILGGGTGDSTDNNFKWLDVLAGTVELNKASKNEPDVHAAGSVGTLNSGATVKLTGTGDYQVYQGGYIYITGGTFDLNGKNQIGTYARIRNTGSKLLNSASTASVFNPTNTVLESGGLTVETVGDIEYGNGISGNYGLTKTGAGKLTLTGASSYTGDTVVNDGMLLLSSTASLSDSSTIKLAADGKYVVSFDGSQKLSDRPIRSEMTGGDLDGLTARLFNKEAIDAQDIGMAWRQRDAEDIAKLLASNVLTLDFSDVPTTGYLLTMMYDPGSIIGDEDALAAAGAIHVVTTATGTHNWINAGTNFRSDLTSLSQLESAVLAIGDYGVDATANTAWVVLNHASDFAVVPEPGTMALLAAALLGLLAYAWRKRR